MKELEMFFSSSGRWVVPCRSEHVKCGSWDDPYAARREEKTLGGDDGDTTDPPAGWGWM